MGRFACESSFYTAHTRQCHLPGSAREASPERLCVVDICMPPSLHEKTIGARLVRTIKRHLKPVVLFSCGRDRLAASSHNLALTL